MTIPGSTDTVNGRSGVVDWAKPVAGERDAEEDVRMS